MTDFDGLIRMEYGILVLVDLTQQSTDLHVSFASILQHLELETRLFRIVEVAREVFRVQVVYTGLKADRALL